MATNKKIKLKENVMGDLRSLLWGPDVKHEVFRRWTQGFCFSEDEPTALKQHEGGPCAVIVPAQAFLIKQLLFTDQTTTEWRNTDDSGRDEALERALLEIFMQLHSTTDVYHIVTSQTPTNNHNTDVTNGEPSTSVAVEEAAQSSAKKQCYSHEQFHDTLVCTECSTRQDLQNIINETLPIFRNEYGILLFLYSIILTKGLEQIKNQMEDPAEPLIDPIHGHGSQSLINLLITGKAASHVFDNEKDISGLKLQGITERSTIGFLTYLEHLRYLEVGWYLKNPENPIWLIGSETHLTLLFSQDKNLVCAESPEAEARRVFTNFDTDGSGFVSCERLGELMSTLNLESDEDYVKIMKDKLDPEQLGIVTLNSFMEEFFPPDSQDDTLSTFHLYHYNGLARSHRNNKVKYEEGTGVLKDNVEVQFLTDTSVIKYCLMTKWPTIELTWNSDHPPSLN